MSAPIYDSILKHTLTESYPFHMPGHKRNVNFIREDFLSLDITELDYSDNLHNPTSVIKEAQDLYAKEFGADKSFFLVNGSSVGLMAAVMSVVKENDEILVARNVHRSVYNGLLLSGASPIYIYPEMLQDNLTGGICPEKLLNALNSFDKVKAFILTSPTYEGFTSDIEKIADICHSKDKILIVDEAHGAHFHYSDKFPKTALSGGADIVVQSLHKTLPVPTQCAVAHIKGDLVDVNLFSSILSILQTTSPSYIFMALIDKCRDELDKNGNLLFHSYVTNLNLLRNSLKNLKNFKLIGENIIKMAEIDDIDISKIIIYTNSINDAKIVEKLLINKYNLEIEGRFSNYLLLMTSVADTKDSFKRLEKALLEIDSTFSSLTSNKRLRLNSNNLNNFIKPKYNIKECFYKESLKLPLIESEGFISKDFVIPYPPGIPLIAPGEIITKLIISEILEASDVIGLEDKNFINVVK